MLLAGITKTSLLDYPGRVAAVLFTGGCNFRCPYCHNRDIVLNSAALTPVSESELSAFLQKRRSVLTGVCITGGEPTLHTDLPDLIARVREFGYPVKLDTNGSNPWMLEKLISGGLIDCCAMDIKNAPGKYGLTIGLKGAAAAAFDLSAIRASVDLLLHSPSISCEFRTTVVKEFHEEPDMSAIARWIRGGRPYFLQSYTDSKGVLCGGLHAHSEETLRAYAELCRPCVPNVAVRGIWPHISTRFM